MGRIAPEVEDPSAACAVLRDLSSSSADFDPAHLCRARATRAMPGNRDRRSHDGALVRRRGTIPIRYRPLGAGVWGGEPGETNDEEVEALFPPLPGVMGLLFPSACR